MYKKLCSYVGWVEQSETQQLTLFMSHIFIKFYFSTYPPITIISTLLYMAMKAGIWPINR